MSPPWVPLSSVPQPTVAASVDAQACQASGRLSDAWFLCGFPQVFPIPPGFSCCSNVSNKQLVSYVSVIVQLSSQAKYLEMQLRN